MGRRFFLCGWDRVQVIRSAFILWVGRVWGVVCPCTGFYFCVGCFIGWGRFRGVFGRVRVSPVGDIVTAHTGAGSRLSTPKYKKANNLSITYLTTPHSML